MIDTDEKHHLVTIDVNGIRQTASVEARKLLVHLLRDDLGLTGTQSVATRRNAAPAPSKSTDRPSNPARFSP
jgi:hypothetical protein